MKERGELKKRKEKEDRRMNDKRKGKNWNYERKCKKVSLGKDNKKGERSRRKKRN